MKAKGKKKAKVSKATCKYRCVRLRYKGSWSAEIRDAKTQKRIWIGTYSSAEEAAKMYDEYAIRIRGKKAKTNFPIDARKVCDDDSINHTQIDPALAKYREGLLNTSQDSCNGAKSIACGSRQEESVRWDYVGDEGFRVFEDNAANGETSYFQYISHETTKDLGPFFDLGESSKFQYELLSVDSLLTEDGPKNDTGVVGSANKTGKDLDFGTDFNFDDFDWVL